MNSRQITTRLPRDLYDKIQAKAIQARRPFNIQIILELEGVFGQSEEISSLLAKETLRLPTIGELT